MRLQSPFTAVSPSGLDAQVLHVLAMTDRPLSASQVHGALPDGGSLAGVKISIRRFVEQGTVLEHRLGRSRGFSMNDEHVLAGAIREIASAKPRLLERMRADVAAWPFETSLVAIFGSAARGDMQIDSDIDVLVVVDAERLDEHVESAVHAFARRISAWTGNDVRPLLYAEGEVGPAPVFDEILVDAIPVAGRLAWLRRRVATSGVRA